MKKVLMSTAVLLLFSLSIVLFQLACKKGASADTQNPTPTVSQVGKIVYTKYPDPAAGGSIYIANYDGSGETKVNLPGVYTKNGLHVAVAPDGTRLFFSLRIPGSPDAYKLYSCKIDGSDLKELKNNGIEELVIQAAF